MGSDERIIRVGTRGSALALWQADHVIARLRAALPGVAIERVAFTTTGDRRLDQPLAAIGEKGVFTADLDAALRAGDITLAVHSLKDVPTTVPPGLAIGAVLARGDPRDAFLSLSAESLDALPQGASVGTSSLRRRAQVLARRPDLEVRDLRGNVPTRIDRLVRGEYDAIVLALAGLERLGTVEHVRAVFDPDVMLPAVGQGTIAVQSRADDGRLGDVLAALEDRPTRLAAVAERTLLARVQGGCQIPFGALARVDGTGMTLKALIADVNGTTVVRDEVVGDVRTTADAEALGVAMADALFARGARRILDRVRRDP